MHWREVETEMEMSVLFTIGAVIGFLLLLLLMASWSSIRPFFQPQHMYALIIEPDRTRKLYWQKPKDGQFVFRGDSTLYYITPKATYKSGRFKIGTCYYVRNNSAPIVFEDLKLDTDLTAQEVFIRQENNVAQQIINTIKPQLLSPAMLLIIIGLMILGSSGFVYWKLNTPLKEIHTAVVPVETAAPENTNNAQTSR